MSHLLAFDTASGRVSRYAVRLAGSLLFGCVTLLAPLAAVGITFDDGALHVIDGGNSYPSESVVVADGPLGASTILQIVDGGQIGAPAAPFGVDASGFSILSMDGGIVHGSISLVDEARFAMSGGSILGAITAQTSGDVDLLGGSLGVLLVDAGTAVVVDGAGIGPVDLSAFGANDLDLRSGALGLVTLSGVSHLTAGGGDLTNGLTATDQATVHFSGADTDLLGADVTATDDVEVDITAGDLGAPLRARGASSWRVTGGRPLLIDVEDDSLFEIEGYGFDRPFGDLSETSGVLTGTLPDCTDVEISFARADPAVIRLVPHPGPLQLTIPLAGSVDTVPGADRGVVESGRGAISAFSAQSCSPGTQILVGDPIPDDWRIEGLEVSSDGAYAVVVGWRSDASFGDHLIWLFDLTTENAVDGVTFRGSSVSGTDRMRAVAVTPTGTRAVALAHNDGGGQDAVIVADLFPVAVTDVIPLPAERANDIVLIDDQNALVTAEYDEFSFEPRGIYVVNLALGQVIDQIDGPEGFQIVTADEIAIARSEGRAYAEMAVLSMGGGIGVIDLATRSVIELLQLPGRIEDVTPDGRRLLTLDTSNDEAILADRLADGSYRLDVHPLSDRPRHGALSEDGRRALVSLTQTDTLASIALQSICDVPGSWPRTAAPFGAGEDHYCEDWSGEALVGVDASGAMLASAALAGADLASAILVGTNLIGAQLHGTDLTGADLTTAELFGAEYDETTIFPSGSLSLGPDWGLPGGATPWSLGMIPVPEPSFRGMMQLGLLAATIAVRGRG